MTMTIHVSGEIRDTDLDDAHVAWSTVPRDDRPTFGTFALHHLAQVLDTVTPPDVGCTSDEVDDCACAPPPPLTLAEVLGEVGCVAHESCAAGKQPVATGQQVADLLGLIDTSPYTLQALAMPVEEVADLLAALAEHNLRWTPGVGGPDAECGTLTEGQPEPPNLHVVFDCYRAAWQRDDERARDDGDPCAHWFGPNGARRTWTQLQRTHDPLTPDGGIAPPPRRPES